MVAGAISKVGDLAKKIFLHVCVYLIRYKAADGGRSTTVKRKKKGRDYRRNCLHYNLNTREEEGGRKRRRRKRSFLR